LVQPLGRFPTAVENEIGVGVAISPSLSFFYGKAPSFFFFDPFIVFRVDDKPGARRPSPVRSLFRAPRPFFPIFSKPRCLCTFAVRFFPPFLVFRRESHYQQAPTLSLFLPLDKMTEKMATL